MKASIHKLGKMDPVLAMHGMLDEAFS